jgi:hypothetical protein
VEWHRSLLLTVLTKADDAIDHPDGLYESDKEGGPVYLEQIRKVVGYYLQLLNEDHQAPNAALDTFRTVAEQLRKVYTTGM